MIIGMTIQTFTLLHVIITLIAIASGFVIIFGMLGSHRLPGLTAIFWLFTLLTSVTGFMFLLDAKFRVGITPALGTGIVAMVVLVFGLVGLYVKNFMGAWRWIYAGAAVLSLYLNVFVLIVQSFQKLKFLDPAAPTVGPPFAGAANTHFAIAQGVALLFFVVMGILAIIKFRPVPRI